MDNRARTELETLIARKEKELSEWKEKQTQSAEWQYANCWTSVYAKLFDRLEPEEVLTVGGVCAEGVYTVEPSNANKCPIECEPGAYSLEGGGGDERTVDVSCGWDRSDEVPGSSPVPS